MAERYAHSADATTDEDAEAITKDAEKATGKDNGATTGHTYDELSTTIDEGKETPTKPAVEVDMIDRVAPNLYPSLDSAANVGITAYDNAHAVLVEAEVVVFTQKFEQRYDLAQGHNYLPVKPAMIPIQALPNLTSNTTTQLNIKVTDADSNDVLAQESHEVELLSLYDFAWVNDEFGSTAAFDILAWLRPQASEVNAINRAAADVLAGWKIEPYSTIAGYQYGNDVFATLLQVAAIQKAISDAGVAYVMDAYSFTSDQHVLTPDAVVQQKHGLCIETSLLMASCLMSAGMHPLLIITPTHAQVAVETYAGSGNYFLIETIILPYSGVNLSLDKTSGAFYNGLLASNTVAGTTHYWTTTGSSDEWKAYLEHTSNGSGQFGGNFVIDCSLQPIMCLQGLENI